jgi:hypothetical protein
MTCGHGQGEGIEHVVGAGARGARAPPGSQVEGRGDQTQPLLPAGLGVFAGGERSPGGQA